MKRLRVLVADDERNARDFLKDLLAEFPFVELAGEAGDGVEALKLIRSESPDLVLLDLEMPEVSGLDVVRQLTADETPLIAFVTAYDEHAVRAFSLNAVDYLLKPVEEARLAQTLNRAVQRLSESAAYRESVDAVRKVANEEEPVTPIELVPVRTGDEIALVKVDEIASVVADGELLHLTTVDNKRYLINFRLKDLEQRLGSERFIRLSRSALANIAMLTSASPMPGGSYLVELANGQRIQASRAQSRHLRDKLLKL